MGIDQRGLQFLCEAHRRGVRFDRTATIGRQMLQVRARDLAAADPAIDPSVLRSSDGYAEDLLRHLGAKAVCSIDASDYERATIVHDLNTPLPAEMSGKFSVVIDGGTLEHVFDFPTAMRSCMALVEPGGHFIGITPSNNLAGHGFYQFSAELFFRIFSEASGFEVERMVLAEQGRHKVFDGIDPDVVGSRGRYRTKRPTYLYYIARRIADVAPLASAPQQSDYVRAWRGGDSEESPPRVPWLPQFARRAVRGGRRTVHAVRARAFDPRSRGIDRRFFSSTLLSQPSLHRSAVRRRAPRERPGE